MVDSIARSASPRELLVRTKTLDFNGLIDQAQRRMGARSDRQLSKKLGRSQASISRWRSGKELPDDASLARLCECAGIDAQLWLVALNGARAMEPARSVYRAIAKRLIAILSTLILCGLAGASGRADGNVTGNSAGSAQLIVSMERRNTQSDQRLGFINIHYAIRALWRRLAARLGRRSIEFSPILTAR
jgi:transcriptional regulator with XRE-family HTH domain